MSGQDAADLERDLGPSLEAMAPPPAPGMLDRVMGEVATAPQRSGSGVVIAGWSRWLAIGGVAAAALLIGILIGSSRAILPLGGETAPSATLETTPSGSPSRVAWTEPTSYVFTFRSYCGQRSLIGTFEVIVEGGTPVGYEPLDERAAAFQGGVGDMPTLGQLMARVDQAKQDVDAVVTLEIDARDSHPTTISIDWKPNAIDDEECYRITRYALYKPASPTPAPSGDSMWIGPASYVYVFDSQCGLRTLSGRYEVTVQDGEPVTFRRLDEGPSFPNSIDDMPTLGELANRVEQARADGDAIVRAYEVDPEDGHPTRIDIDWLPNAIDDEECYVIESYLPDV